MRSRKLLPIAVLAVLAAPVGRAREICLLAADAGTGRVIRQVGTCDGRVTPASTFKIAISLMGYDSGFLLDAHRPALQIRPGDPDWLPEWRRTTDPTSWIANSVVWYSQRVTRSLGEERFRRYVRAFHYGNADVSGDPGRRNGLTEAWLDSSLRISPREQVSFLRELVARRLPVRAQAFDMTARITAVAMLPTGWAVHGKAGTGSGSLPDGSRDEPHQLGWFVGWATRERHSVVFAYLIREDEREAVRAGLRARADLLRRLPSILEQSAAARG